MPATLIAALFFTVALLVVTAYFIMGSLPLLTLKHDTPMDGRFVSGFFNTYYRAATVTASATAVSYAMAVMPALSAGAAGLALLAIGLRRLIIPKMDALRGQMQAGAAGALSRFRRLHAVAIVINLAQLVGILWCLISLSMQMR